MACKLLVRENVVKFLSSFDTVLTDCDGVLWKGTTPIAGVALAIQKLKALGKRVYYLTNNSTKTRTEYVEKLNSMGYPAEKSEIIGSAYVAAQYIKHKLNYNGKAYVIGSTGLSGELDLAGIPNTGVGPDYLDPEDVKNLPELPLDPDIKCVVVGLDTQFNYLKMAKALHYLKRDGCHFIATNTDADFPAANGRVIPGTGSIVSAVETAAKRCADAVMGKPHPEIVEVLQNQHGNVDPTKTLMIGDRLNTDILLAGNCGFQSLFVLTGINTLKDVQELDTSSDENLKKQIPNYYLNSLSDLGVIIDGQS